MSSAVQIHDHLRHPVLDCDGHWLEPFPVLLEYLREVAGAKVTDDFVALHQDGDTWYAASPEERMSKRIRRGLGWGSPSETMDRATAMLPGLMVERMGELGIDFGIVYPTLALPFSNFAREDIRRGVIRAYNKMSADMYAPYRDRLTPAAILPPYTPQEAIEEAEYAVRELGLKVVMIRGALPRPMPAYTPGSFGTSFEHVSSGMPYFVDSLGLDNPYDYDPLWQKCLDLGLAVTGHGGSHEWADRKAVDNFVYNHIGHFAQANHVFTKGIFLGGVTRRFPKLNFAFLEGGVGYAVNLLLDLAGHWEKLNPAAVRKNLCPDNLDLPRLRDLIEQYGSDRVRANGDVIMERLSSAEQNEPGDDFGAAHIGSKRELVSLYSRNFYFGCEADDPVTAWAFDDRMGARLKAVFSSDISHFDVPEMSGVLPEAYEMVEKGLLTEQDFKDFTFSNAVHLHGEMNPHFFEGTAIERQAAAELRRAVAA